MARKDIFANITSGEGARPERKATPGYASRGASRSMINSLGELAEKASMADRLMAGDTVVELDPGLIDASFVSDRMEGDEEALTALVAAIKAHGQDTPILVRTHPQAEGRYQVVFGHRRLKAAQVLERSVRAVVKAVGDVEHVIAQGQENSARENLSFIERAVFAQQLLERGYERTTIQASLSIDAPMLTRMLSVTARVPVDIARAVGAAKSIGRDRWLELAYEMERPAVLEKARGVIAEPGFAALGPDNRFEHLLAAVKSKAAAKARVPADMLWQPGDKAVTVQSKKAGKSYMLTLKARDAGRFGAYLTNNLDRFYEQFRQDETNEETK